MLARKTDEILVFKVKKAASEVFGITRLQLMAKAGHVAREMSLFTPF